MERRNKSSATPPSPGGRDDQHWGQPAGAASHMPASCHRGNKPQINYDEARLPTKFALYGTSGWYIYMIQDDIYIWVFINFTVSRIFNGIRRMYVSKFHILTINETNENISLWCFSEPDFFLVWRMISDDCACGQVPGDGSRCWEGGWGGARLAGRRWEMVGRVATPAAAADAKLHLRPGTTADPSWVTALITNVSCESTDEATDLLRP